MKWKTLGRSAKALTVSLALGLGMTACTRDYTVAYVYATAATRTTMGVVNAYAVDYASGALQQLADSPIPSGGSNPVALVATPNGNYIYVVNHDTSQVVQFDVGTDGKLYAENSYNVVQGSGVAGSFPVAATIDPTGTFLYVAFTFQNGFTTASPGPGGVATFPINTDGTLGTPLTSMVTGTALPYVQTGFNPVGIVASAYNHFVYVVEQDTTTSAQGVTSSVGSLLTFSANATTGALTAVPGPVSIIGAVTGTPVGVRPSAIAEDPSARFLYISDQVTNQLFGFLVTANGAPQTMASSPYTTGSFPLGVTVDPRGSFVYVANNNDNTISTYAVNVTTGALSGSGSSAVSTGPTCVSIEPARGIYLYTSNNRDNTVSADQLDPHSGALQNVQGTPYTASALPTCITTVANGAHPTQLVPAN